MRRFVFVIRLSENNKGMYSIVVFDNNCFLYKKTVEQLESFQFKKR